MRLYVSFLLFAFVAALITPSSARAQTRATCAAAYDSNGIRVGSIDGLALNGGDAVVFFENQGSLVILQLNRDVLRGQNTVLFTEADCTGDAYIEWTEFNEVQPTAALVGTDLWHLDPAAALEPFVLVESWRRPNDAAGACNNNVSFAPPTSSPAIHLTLSFTPPFHLEPEPCFIPEDPDPEQVINACMKNKGGALRVVADPADCTSRETPITLLSP